jgi:hypothetical protein
MKNFLLAVSFSIGIISNLFAQQEVVDQDLIQKIRSEGLNNSQVMKTAFYLTDVSGPRLSNSPGLRGRENRNRDSGSTQRS